MRAAALIALFAVALAGCQRAPAPVAPAVPVDSPTPRRLAAMSMDPAVFAQVSVGTHARNAASPTPPPDPRWRGILLAAPRVVRPRAGATASVPLCLYAMLDVPAAPLAEGMRVVVTGPSLAQPVAAPVVDVDESPSVPPPDEAPHDPATLRGVAVGGYQNHDLMALVGLPHGSAVYTVHLELGSTRSNEVTVEIAAQP